MNRWRTALVASVILNLFLAGALVAGYASLRTGKRMIAAGSLRIAGSELPATERCAFRAALRDARGETRPAIRQGRTARAEAADLLRRPSVDQPAMLAALARARAADAAVREAVERRAVAFAAALPPADRARLADAMRRRGARAVN